MCKPIHDEPFASPYRVSHQKLPNTDIVPFYGLDKYCLQVFMCKHCRIREMGW